MKASSQYLKDQQENNGEKDVKSKVTLRSFNPSTDMAASSGGDEDNSQRNPYLPQDFQKNAEKSLGIDLGRVNIYQNSQNAIRSKAKALTIGNNIYFAPKQFNPYSEKGQDLLAHELTHVAQQQKNLVSGQSSTYEAAEKEAISLSDSVRSGQNIQSISPFTYNKQQKNPEDPPERVKIYVKVYVTKTMNREEFILFYLQQHYNLSHEDALDQFNRNPDRFTGGWKVDQTDVERGYTLVVKSKSVEDFIEGHKVELINEERNENGKRIGYKDRLQLFHGLRKKEQELIEAETTRRYKMRVGLPESMELKEENKNITLWNDIRDEVIYQRGVINSIPDNLKFKIFTTDAGEDGRFIEPKDYNRLHQLINEINSLSAIERNELFESWVPGNITDMESAIDNYKNEKERRNSSKERYTDLYHRVSGLKYVYLAYKAHKSFLSTAVLAKNPMPIQDEIAEFDEYIKEQGFGDSEEFKNLIKQYTDAFTSESEYIVFDILDRYEKVLQNERKRYQSDENVQSMFNDLGGYRSLKGQERETLSQASNLIKRPNRHDIPPLSEGEMKEYYRLKEKSTAYGNQANQQIKELSADYPILRSEKAIDIYQHDNLDDFKNEIYPNIQQQLRDIAKTREYLAGDPKLIFKMKPMIPTFYEMLGVEEGSVHDLIIKDEYDFIAKVDEMFNTALTVLGLALAVLSFGSGTALLALASFGLSSYTALQDLNNYDLDSTLYYVGLIDEEPSFAWVVVSVMGAAFDLGGAVSVLRTIEEPARVFTQSIKNASTQEAQDALEIFHKQVDEHLIEIDPAAAERLKQQAQVEVNARNTNTADEHVTSTKKTDLQNNELDDFKSQHKEDFELHEKLDDQISNPNKTDSPKEIVDDKKFATYVLASMIVNYGDSNNLHPAVILPALQNLAKKPGANVKGFSYRLEGKDKAKFFLHGSLFSIHPGDGIYDYSMGLGELADIDKLDGIDADISKIDFKELDVLDKTSMAINNADYSKMIRVQGLVFERRVTKAVKTGEVAPFSNWIEDGYEHYTQLHLKSLNSDKRIIGDDVFIKAVSSNGVSYKKAIYHDSKLKEGSPWTENQKSELIKIFETTDKPYVEFEVRSSNTKLNTNGLLSTGEKVRIYREDVYKTISDENLQIDRTYKIF